MRIAVVCPYALDRPGGVRGQVLGLAAALRAQGAAVTVVGPAEDAGSVGEGVVVVGHPVGVRTNGSVAPVALSPLAAVRARRAVAAAGADVVHLHEPLAPVTGYGLLRKPTRPTVATFHRSGAGSFERALHPLAHAALARLDVRCAVSEAARATAVAIGGGDYEVLFNGVDTARFADAAPWSSDVPTVFFVGRLEARKGLRVLLEAWAAVPGPARLSVAGAGPDADALRSEHPASARLEWLGPIDDAALPGRVAGSDVLCAPSLYGESFGVVLLEAMAAGTPVVASDLPGYREAAAGHARLVAPGDAGALAAALTEALADASAGRGASSPGARRAATEYAVTRSTAALATAYLEVYERARRVHGRPGAREGAPGPPPGGG